MKGRGIERESERKKIERESERKKIKRRNKAQRKIDYKNYDATTFNKNYEEKLLQEIIS